MEKFCKSILPALLVLSIIGITIYNLFVNFKDFFKLNFSQASTLIVAILIVYYANQIITDKRKIKENIERIALSIQKFTDDRKYFDFSDFDDNRIAVYLIMQKKIKNYIYILKKYSKKEKIGDYIKYIEDEFNFYNDLVSENQSNIELLIKSKNTLVNKLQNISTKCNEMIAEMYC